MNLLITGAWSEAQSHIVELEAMGHCVAFQQQEKDPLQVNEDWVEGVIGNGLFLSHPIERFTNLRYIQLTSAGYDRVPMSYVREHNIEIHNARGVYSIPMAEFALAGVLSLFKKLQFFAENQKQHQWVKHRGLWELHGKTVCIVGCGDVGAECAKRFAAFGCRVIGVNRTVRFDSLYEKIFGLDKLDEVLPEADILVLTIPLTEQTRHMIGSVQLQLMKSEAVLVNIARGAVVDFDALEKHISKLGGAVLDVFPEEPLSAESPLWDAENVLITPHNSFVGEGNSARLSGVILDNLKRS